MIAERSFAKDGIATGLIDLAFRLYHIPAEGLLEKARLSIIYTGLYPI